MPENWIEVGSVQQLAAGPIRTEFDGWPIAVVRIDGALHAYEDRCTHDGETLAGAEVDDGALVCPRHGARFCLRTGEALTPPAYEPIRIFAVRERDGRIEVGGVA